MWEAATASQVTPHRLCLMYRTQAALREEELQLKTALTGDQKVLSDVVASLLLAELAASGVHNALREHC